MESATRLISKSYSLASKNHPPYIYSLLILSILALIIYLNQGLLLVQSGFSGLVSSVDKESSSHSPDIEKLPFALEATKGDCDLFKGKWVWDNVTYPLYKEEDCPYMDLNFMCHANGRPDSDYLFWRWQPHGCNLPSFNASLILESIRDKRMLFVGDSLNRGQFFSMVCLFHSTVPASERSLKGHDSFITFHAKSFNATVEFYWAPYLLESNSDNILAHKISEGIVRKDSIDKHGQHWKAADIIIFDTYTWWLTGSDMKVVEGSFEDKPLNIVKLSTEEAYGMAINALFQWVDKNMDRTKNRVFFSSMSPYHRRSEEWGEKEGGNCRNETTMITDEKYLGAGCSKSMMQVMNDELAKSMYPITLLNISELSSYRKDAHVSIYKKRWSAWTPEEIALQNKYPDCMHFCLPGLQDTWNELLFAKLLHP